MTKEETIIEDMHSFKANTILNKKNQRDTESRINWVCISSLIGTGLRDVLGALQCSTDSL